MKDADLFGASPPQIDVYDRWTDYQKLAYGRKKIHQKARAITRKMFGTYPDDELSKHEWMQEFQSKENEKHHSRFFELYIAHLFGRLGFQVKPHATIPSSERNIDFRMEHSGERPCWVECTTLGHSPIEKRDIKIINDIRIRLNERFPESPFSVSMSIGRSGNAAPSIKSIIHGLEKSLSNPRLTEVSASQLHIFKYTWARGDWIIDFSPNKRSKGDSFINGYDEGEASTSHGEDTYRRLKDKITDKLPHRYRAKGFPYIIAINVVNYMHYSSDDLLHKILTGGYNYHDKKMMRRRDSGVLGTASKPQNRDLSGILVCNGLASWNIDHTSAQPTLWLMPSPSHNFPELLWPGSIRKYSSLSNYTSIDRPTAVPNLLEVI